MLCFHIGTKGCTVPPVIYESCASFVVCQNRGMFVLKPRGTILDHLPYVERFCNIAVDRPCDIRAPQKESRISHVKTYGITKADMGFVLVD